MQGVSQENPLCVKAVGRGVICAGEEKGTQTGNESYLGGWAGVFTLPLLYWSNF